MQGLVNWLLEVVARPDDLALEMPLVFGFTLDNDAIHEFDAEHPSPGREPVPWGIKARPVALCMHVL